MNTIYIHHIHPHSSFPYALPLHRYPPPEKTCFTLLPFFFIFFFKHIVQGDFALAFQTCIYHALTRLTPHYLLFLYHHAPLLFNSLLCITLYYIQI
jgi:hypothetical protein